MEIVSFNSFGLSESLPAESSVLKVAFLTARRLQFKKSGSARITILADRIDETAGTCAAEVTSSTALDTLLATLLAAPITSPTAPDTTLVAFGL